jgi:hypothetical protein
MLHIEVEHVLFQFYLKFPYTIQNGNKSRIWVKSMQSLGESFKISLFHFMTWVC